MNSNFSCDRCAAARVKSREGSRGVMWVMAAACLLAPISVGCQTGGHAVVHQPAFDQLEQGCFGYEPTVWRTMAVNCEQAIRMIPDEAIQTPVPVATSVPAEVSVPPTEDGAEVPDEADLGDVPDRGPLDVPRIVAPPDDMPRDSTPDASAPAETPPAVSPSAVPDVPPAAETPKQPASETPPAKTPPAADPKVPAATEPEVPASTEPPVTSMRPQFGPVINGPVIQASSSKATAAALFRTVSQALAETSQLRRVAKKPAAVNLSRFISY